jgi:hypothetical protein
MPSWESLINGGLIFSTWFGRFFINIVAQREIEKKECLL